MYKLSDDALGHALVVWNMVLCGQHISQAGTFLYFTIEKLPSLGNASSVALACNQTDMFLKASPELGFKTQLKKDSSLFDVHIAYQHASTSKS